MRIAILSDIHANLVALDAVLAAIGSVDAIWQLGDVVGYGPEPDAVVDRLRAAKASGVRGNHDAAAIGELETDLFNHDARRAIEWTGAIISKATRDWLAALPERRTEDDLTLVHGSPRDPIWEYVTTAPVARLNLEVLKTPYGLHGHTHLPSVFRDEDGFIEVAQSVARVGPGARRAPSPGEPGQRGPAARRRPAGERRRDGCRSGRR